MRFSIARWVVAFVSFGFLAAASSKGLALEMDQVFLKNGDRITGRVLTSSIDSVSLATEAAGTISIRRALIAQVLSDSTEPASKTPAATVAGSRTVPQVQSTTHIEPVGALASSLNTTHCLEHLKPVPMTWALQFQGAPNEVIVGTVSQDLFGAGIDISSCEGSPNNQTSFAASGTHSRFYEHGAGAIVADVADAELEQQHFFHSTEGAAIYAVGDAFNNNALGMAMQKGAGFGWLSPQYRYKAAAYDFAGDIRYLNQHLDGVSPALNLASVRLKEQMHIQGTLFHLDEQGWIMPSLNDVHALQAYASIAPSVTLKPWLTLGISEEESYLENAPPPRLKNYFTSALTLTFQSGSGVRSK